MKLRVGQKAPNFTLPSHLGGEVSLSQYRGKSVVIAFFPQAWTPILSEQIPSYQAQSDKFTGLNAQVLGISVDHVPCLIAWADNLTGIHYPLLSDFWPHGKVAKKYGVLRKEGYTERAIFVIDKNGIIRYIDVHDIDNQPNNEVLFEELRRIDPESALKEPLKQSPVQLPEGGIVMYCNKWCPDCRRARIWLKEQNLDYTEVDIYATPGALEQARKWGQGKLITPTFNINGTIVLDFDEQQLRQVLNR